jgi:hypothetical protein
MTLKAYTHLFTDGPQLPSLRIPIQDEMGTAFLDVCGISLSDAADQMEDGTTIQHAIDIEDGTASDTYDDPASLVRDIVGRSFSNQAAGVVLSRDDQTYLLTVYYLVP